MITHPEKVLLPEDGITNPWAMVETADRKAEVAGLAQHVFEEAQGPRIVGLTKPLHRLLADDRIGM